MIHTCTLTARACALGHARALNSLSSRCNPHPPCALHTHPELSHTHPRASSGHDHQRDIIPSPHLLPPTPSHSHPTDPAVGQPTFIT
eukprot:3500835-Rhodomonas_salina.3